MISIAVPPIGGGARSGPSHVVILGVTTLLAGLRAAGAMLLSTSDLQLPPTVATVEDALRILDRTDHHIFRTA